MSEDIASEFPVLIAGGGLIGLSLSMFLAQQGIASLAIEKLRGGSPVPRAAHFHLRTLETFRQAGVEDDVIAKSFEEFLPEGAIIAMDSLAGKKLADIIGSLNAGVEEVSPCKRLFITQPGLEPILRRRARQAGARILEGYEVVALAQDADGVTVSARNVDDGSERQFRGKYLVGADGAHSKVRTLLDIPFDGRGVFSNSMTIYFRADLAPLLLGKPLSVIYINNAAFGGFFRVDKDCQGGFLAVNTVGDPKVDPVAAANPAGDISEERLVALVRAGIGDPDVAVTITGVARWRATSDVARTMQRGRIVLAGDAAHLMPPNGGFGGNTGVHDAHNLAWKLAYAVKGLAGPQLVDTYDTERRPICKFTVEQAYTRYVTRTATYLNATDFQPPAHDFEVEIGHLYHSPAVIPDGADTAVHADPRQTRGRAGSRAPHVWLERAGERISTLDLYGHGFVVMAGSGGEGWKKAVAAAKAKFPGLPVECHLVGRDLADPEGQFEAAYGLSPTGAALVRPDGFVGWRSASLSDDVTGDLMRSLARLLAKV